jgi:hypothetical protein
VVPLALQRDMTDAAPARNFDTGDRAGSVPAKPWRQDMRLLLLLPFIGLLAVPMFNTETPEFAGFPFFYWYMFAWVPLTSILIWLVNRNVKSED